MVVSYVLPIIALSTKQPWVNVNYFDYLTHIIPITFVYLLLILWLKEHSWLRPKNVDIISWQSILFQFARWPWALLGILEGIIYALINREPQFSVTPKGKRESRHLDIKILLPYIFIAMTSGAVALFTDHAGFANGYYFFAVFNTIIYTLIIILVISLHLHENHRMGHVYEHRNWIPKFAVGASFIAFAWFLIVWRGDVALSIFTGRIDYSDAKSISLDNDKTVKPAPYAPTSLASILGFPVENIPTDISSTEIPIITKYTVLNGDSLWSISNLFYGYGREWRKIRNANKDQIGFLITGEQTLLRDGMILDIP
jgi:hypothetical protein